MRLLQPAGSFVVQLRVVSMGPAHHMLACASVRLLQPSGSFVARVSVHAVLAIFALRLQSANGCSYLSDCKQHRQHRYRGRVEQLARHLWH